MPSPKRDGHTALLVQLPDDLHAAADARRRVERVTWARVITTLLARWSAGDPIEGSIRRRAAPAGAPTAPPRRREPQVPGARVVIPAERWHRSAAAAVLARAGKPIPDDLPTFDGDDGGDGSGDVGG